MWQIIFVLIGMVFSFYTRISVCMPCGFNFRENLNVVNVSSGGNVFVFLTESQNNCSIDLDYIYGKTLQNAFTKVYGNNSDEVEVLKKLHFFCFKNSTLHFVTNDTNNVGRQRVGIELRFEQCEVYLEELLLFLKYGNIRAILQYNDSKIHTPSRKVICPFAKSIMAITASVYCDSATDFFWESCTGIFEEVNILELRAACKTNPFRIKSENLAKRFPKLQLLQLENIELLTQLTFPWTLSYVDTAVENLSIYPSEMANSSITILNLGKIIRIYDSNIDISNMLHLDGNIAEVVINDAYIQQNEGQLFRNVTGLYKVDLSSNKLIELNETLFENHSEIQKIYLNENNLTILPPYIFKDQRKLVFLDLSNNKLSLIDSNLLKTQRNLQELHLENNRIQVLPQDFLKEQTHSLRSLYLHSNPIKTIPVMPFYGTNIDLIDIQRSDITGESIVELMNTVRFYDMLKANNEWEASHPGCKHSLQQRVLDLSFCKIRDIRFDLDVNDMVTFNFLALFKSFYIKGDGNPFTCDCQLYDLKFLLSGASDIKIEWTCVYPKELEGKAVAKIAERDVYCPYNVTDCPKLCVCNIRYDFSSLIVDCRDMNMSTLPLEMPKYPLELWFKNTSLLQLEPRDYLLNVSVLDVSENKLTVISPLATLRLQNVDVLNLANNYLTSLPVQMKYTNISSISLTGNAFLCDCHTRWMRTWLHDRLCPVTDWDTIKCTDYNKKVNKIVHLPASVFVCNELKPPSIAEHVIFPSIVIGSILFVIMVLSLTIYFQRFTVRVLLYMLFGVRICDGVSVNSDDFRYDCVVIYDRNDVDFVENKIKKHLRESGYKVADMYKDSLIGFTFIEGITKLIIKSKRVLFCMTKHSVDCELITILWNIASERVLKNKIGAIILIVGRDAKCTDENMKLYVKNGRYLKLESKLLHESIEYLLSEKKQVIQNHGENDSGERVIETNHVDEISLCENVRADATGYLQENAMEEKHDIYVVYSDVVDELHQLSRYNIIPFLRENKLNACVLLDDFVFGEDIRYGIEPKLDEARHVIFILSNETFEDDVMQYLLTTIVTKAFLSNSNYLLIFSYGQINVDNMTENVKKYVNSYITASVNDFEFKERMLDALMCEENISENDDIESSVTEDDVSLI